MKAFYRCIKCEEIKPSKECTYLYTSYDEHEMYGDKTHYKHEYTICKKCHEKHETN